MSVLAVVTDKAEAATLYILQRGVQWKHGVVIRVVLYTILLYNTIPIHCTPLPLHPPVMNTHTRRSPGGVGLSCAKLRVSCEKAQFRVHLVSFHI